MRRGPETASSPIPILVHVLETSLRLLHPYLPFITEELWQNLKQRLPTTTDTAESIMIAAYPQADDTTLDPEAERVMAALIEIVHAMRNVRAEYNIATGQWITARIDAGELAAALAPYSPAIEVLARARPVTFATDDETTTADNAITLVLKESKVLIPLGSLVDMETERKRLQTEIDKLQQVLSQTEARLNNQSFLTKAPPAVVDGERHKYQSLSDKLARLQQQLSQL